MTLGEAAAELGLAADGPFEAMNAGVPAEMVGYVRDVLTFFTVLCGP